MKPPVVSVLLPVYNAGPFLRQAIDSILAQTFTDFELLLINDGSTDNSETIILSYKDVRIKYIKNTQNSGLVFSLNRGVDLARGEYIARMDADDICMPQRLEKQVAYFRTYPSVSLVAGLICFIDEKNNETGSWKTDRETISPERIKKVMPKESCLAHPTIMIRTPLLQEFKYNASQKHIEDYDLWLRLLNRKVVIAKLPEVVLRYRIHETSVTQTSAQISYPAKRVFDCKRTFVLAEMKSGRVSAFLTRVIFFMLIDFTTYVYKRWKAARR